MKNLLIAFLVIFSLLIPGMGANWEFYPYETATGKYVIPTENKGGPWMGDGGDVTFGTDLDAIMQYVSSADALYLNMTAADIVFYTADPTNDTLTIYQPIVASGGITGAITGTASRIAVGSFIDTSYGLKNSTSNKAQVNLSASSGLEFGTGATLGALKIDPADKTLTLASGGVSLTSGIMKRVLAAGTAAATNVTVSGMASGDELVSVVSYATAAAISTMADRTSEYAIGTGQLTKAAGTNETDNQLDIWYIDRTA